MLTKAKPVAERVLSDLWGRKITLGQDEGLGGSDRSNVYRFQVLSVPLNGPRASSSSKRVNGPMNFMIPMDLKALLGGCLTNWRAFSS